MTEHLYKYKNGNVDVTILKDGTKIRKFDGDPAIRFPESIDCKITNYCDMNCQYCHEESDVNGKHADLYVLKQHLLDLPSGIEIAIGGGNPLSHPDLVTFLNWLRNRGIIPNLTVNQNHISQYHDLLITLLTNEFIFGLGISITNDNFDVIKDLMKYSNNIVFHLIIGIHDIDILNKFNELPYNKTLLLGYKTFGNGVDYYEKKSVLIKNNIDRWYKYLPKYFNTHHFSFDNLAIEQLKIKRYFTEKGWNQFYMGDDFTNTMYIDAVEQQFAPTSRSPERTSFKDISLIEYFQQNHL